MENLSLLMKETNLVCQALDVEPLSKACDFIFTALPHKTAMEVVRVHPERLKGGGPERGFSPNRPKSL